MCIRDRYPIFVDGATGTQGVESDTGLSYNPSSGNLTSTQLTGTLQTAAQTNITSVGTLSSLDVTGNVTIGGTITYDDVTFLDSIGVATARSGLDVGAGTITPIISIQASTDTTTTTSASTIDSFVAATFRSAQYQIQITQGSNYHVTTLNVFAISFSFYIIILGNALFVK